MAAFCSALGTVLLILVVVAAAPAAVPRAFGLQVYEVISGSMAPEIPTGSLVYVRKAKAEQIQAEDVIAYDGGGGALITHRVVENRTLMGEFVTKGDANEKEDPNPVSYDQLRGQVVYSIPYLGWIAGLISETGSGRNDCSGGSSACGGRHYVQENRIVKEDGSFRKEKQDVQRSWRHERYILFLVMLLLNQADISL